MVVEGELLSLGQLVLVAGELAVLEQLVWELELLAAVDSQGRSLKPAQLQFWLSQSLGFDLSLSRVRRVELTLLQC